MADKLTPENFMFTFRCYRGEDKNPYATDNSPNGRAWAATWDVEKNVAQKSPEEVIDLWGKADEYESEAGEKGIPKPIADSNIPESEKAFAFAVFSAADTFMTEKALADYLKWPVVEVIGE